MGPDPNNNRPVKFSLQARQYTKQLVLSESGLARLSFGKRVLHSDDNLILLYNIAFSNQDIGDNAALKMLHDLNLARRDDLTFATRDLIKISIIRPKEEKDEKRNNSEQQNVSETARSTANLGAYFTCRKNPYSNCYRLPLMHA